MSEEAPSTLLPSRITQAITDLKQTAGGSMYVNNVSLEEADSLGEYFENDGEFERSGVHYNYNSLRRLVTFKTHTRIHSTGTNWICCAFSGWCYLPGAPPSMRLDLGVGGRPTLKRFGSPYEGSQKSPDTSIFRAANPNPVLVAEVAWSESDQALEEDGQIWWKGLEYNTVVILIKYETISNGRVTGKIKLMGKRGVQETRTIFPIPDPAEPDDLRIQLRDLYGSSLPSSYSGEIELPLLMSELRHWADRAIRAMNLTPA